MPNGCSTIRASISPSRRAAANPASIISAFRPRDSDELKEIYARLHKAGGNVIEQGQTSCCYAKSEKSWIDDPAGISWETFLTTGESTDYGDGSGERVARVAHQKAAACRKLRRRSVRLPA